MDAGLGHFPKMRFVRRRGAACFKKTSRKAWVRNALFQKSSSLRKTVSGFSRSCGRTRRPFRFRCALKNALPFRSSKNRPAARFSGLFDQRRAHLRRDPSFQKALLPLCLRRGFGTVPFSFKSRFARTQRSPFFFQKAFARKPVFRSFAPVGDAALFFKRRFKGCCAFSFQKNPFHAKQVSPLPFQTEPPSPAPLLSTEKDGLFRPPLPVFLLHFGRSPLCGLAVCGSPRLTPF